MSDASHVGTWTPLVTNFTGSLSAGLSGQIGRHIFLVTSPCSWLTPFTDAADRSASAVMLNCGPAPLS